MDGLNFDREEVVAGITGTHGRDVRSKAAAKKQQAAGGGGHGLFLLLVPTEAW